MRWVMLACSPSRLKILRGKIGVKLSKVRYEFEVAGELHRDSDLVLPVIAERWDRGTIIQVLYLPKANFDSVIISTS